MNYWETIFYQIKKIIISVPLAAFAYVAPVKPLGYTIFFFIIVDTITGIWAAYNRSEKIHSSKMSPVIAKIIAYLIAITVAFVFDNEVILSDDLWITRGTVFLLSSIEVKSIFENLAEVTGIEFWKRLKHLFERHEEKT